MQTKIPDAYARKSVEALVLEGYRNWSRNILNRSVTSWIHCRTLFTEKLGAANGKLAFDTFCHFTETLCFCANCPLKTQPCGSHGLCKDEVFILGLIAGLQRDDDQVVEVCLTALSCQNRCDDVIAAANAFASTLKASNLILSPIPLTTLKGVLSGQLMPASIH